MLQASSVMSARASVGWPKFWRMERWNFEMFRSLLDAKWFLEARVEKRILGFLSGPLVDRELISFIKLSPRYPPNGLVLQIIGICRIYQRLMAANLTNTMAEKLYKTNRVTWNSLFRILRSRDNGEWKFEGGIIVQADGDFPVDGFYSFSKY